MFDLLIRLLQLLQVVGSCQSRRGVFMLRDLFYYYFGILQVSKLDFFEPGRRLMYKKTPQNSRDKVHVKSVNVCGSQTGSYQT